MDDKPKLRPLDALPVDLNGERAIALRDNSGMTQNVVALPPPAFFLAAHFDGVHTISDIQARFTERFGARIEAERIHDLVRQLDDAFLMEGEKFEAHKGKVIEDFRAARVRRPAHAGQAYPRHREELRSRLDGFFTAPDGPGPVDRLRHGSGVVAVAAPHIDLQRGGPSYAHAYKPLVENCSATTFIILGTLHQPADGLYLVTDKDFETPLGTVKCDREFVAELRRRAHLEQTDAELAHLGEHSVEFQTLFLRRFFGPSHPARIVPVLCGPILHAAGQAHDPMEVPEIGNFISALRAMLAERDGQAAVIASVDLSHVGPRFGDAVEMTDDLLKRLESEDRALLKHAESLDPAAFFEHNRERWDRTHVCGFPALYTLLSTVAARRGRLLHYAQAPEEQTHSVVTFGAMVFEK